MNPEQPDLRVRRTRKLLQEALLSLLQDHDLEAISVNEICDQAMVHRTTFYKHYQDKYDLLKQSLHDRFQALAAVGPTPEEVVTVASAAAPASATADGAAPGHFVRIFQHVAENRAFYAAALSSGGGSVFRELLEAYVAETASARIGALTQGKPSLSIPAPVLAQFSAGALVNLLIWWLRQKAPPAPLEMAQYAARLLNYGMIPILGEQHPSKPLG